MPKLISYLYPITKKVPSDFSGTLEITWYNGKKHLNTENANYSYGSLQKVLKFGLTKIDFKNVNSVLLLGLGGGSVIETLREDFKYSNPIMAVDIDQKIIEIAKHEFNLKDDGNLSIICEDALEFMALNKTQYDLIIIDVFIDMDVPEAFLAIPFFEDVLKSSSANGSIVFNASLYKTKTNALQDVIDYLKSKFFKVEIFEKVNNTNTVVIAKGL
ncbi:MAG: fused MFS/spermidine synthase [Gelidibacter sp.]